MQYQNAASPIEVTPLPMVTLVSEVHQENACVPIEVTLSGMVILVSEHPLNAHSPIEVTLSGMVMLVSEVQYQNAHSPIEVTLSGMVYSVSPAGAKEFNTPSINTPSIIKQRPSSEANLPLNSARLEQQLNAPYPISVTLSGMVTLARLSQ